jgi:hypothetical protein
MLISTGLHDISEMSAVEAAHQAVELIEMRPCTDDSAGMFLYILWCHCGFCRV